MPDYETSDGDAEPSSNDAEVVRQRIDRGSVTNPRTDHHLRTSGGRCARGRSCRWAGCDVWSLRPCLVMWSSWAATQTRSTGSRTTLRS